MHTGTWGARMGWKGLGRREVTGDRASAWAWVGCRLGVGRLGRLSWAGVGGKGSNTGREAAQTKNINMALEQQAGCAVASSAAVEHHMAGHVGVTGLPSLETPCQGLAPAAPKSKTAAVARGQPRQQHRGGSSGGTRAAGQGPPAQRQQRHGVGGCRGGQAQPWPGSPVMFALGCSSGSGNRRVIGCSAAAEARVGWGALAAGQGGFVAGHRQQGKAGCRRTVAGCWRGQGGLWHVPFNRRSACAVRLGGGGTRAMAPAAIQPTTPSAGLSSAHLVMHVLRESACRHGRGGVTASAFASGRAHWYHNDGGAALKNRLCTPFLLPGAPKLHKLHSCITSGNAST